jgi:hypothetical protein
VLASESQGVFAVAARCCKAVAGPRKVLTLPGTSPSACCLPPFSLGRESWLVMLSTCLLLLLQIITAGLVMLLLPRVCCGLECRYIVLFQNV